MSSGRSTYVSGRLGAICAAAAVTLGFAAVGLATAPSSLAAFPGQNGLIAFESNRDAGNFEIYTMNADGSLQTNITTNPAGDAQPSWSPDGRKIVFATNRDGNSEIYVMNADGSQPVRLTADGATDIFPCWSRTARRSRSPGSRMTTTSG